MAQIKDNVAQSAAEGDRIRAIASWYTHHPCTVTPAEWPESEQHAKKTPLARSVIA